MASVSDYLKAKLNRFKTNVLGPSTPPPDVVSSNPAVLRSERARLTLPQVQPMISDARESFVNRFPIQEVKGSPIPRFNIAQPLTSKIPNPLLRAGLRFGAGEPFNALMNIPTDVTAGAVQFTQGAQQLGTALGKKQDPQEAISNILTGAGRTSSGALELLTLGKGKQLLQQAGKAGFKNAVKQGAKTGAKLGAGFGAAEGLIAQPGQELKDQLGQVALTTGAGALLGGAAGGLAGAIPGAIGAVRGAINPKTGRLVSVRGAGGKFAGSKRVGEAITPQEINSTASAKEQLKLARDYIKGVAEKAKSPGEITRAARVLFRNSSGGAKKRQQIISAGMQTYKQLQKSGLTPQGGEYFGAFAGIEQDEEGNIRFNPEKAAIGLAGTAAINRNKGRIFKNGQTLLPSNVAKKGSYQIDQARFLAEAANPEALSKSKVPPSAQPYPRVSPKGTKGQTNPTQTLAQSLTPPPQGPGRPFSEHISGSSDIPVGEKVGLHDYLRTPDRVLQKIGLGKEAEYIRGQYNKYLQELPPEIEKITQWAKRVPSAESNTKIFKYLDGQDGVLLAPEEQRVANEIRDYLAGWADRLGLPKDKRIASYITHIFEKDFIQKEFDPDVAKIIRDKVAGSVYDPFLESRLGKQGYVEDTWRALDAYVKRATRKANLDPALAHIKESAKNLEESQFDYVKRYVDRVNMRPTWWDNLLDNTLKQVFGYKLGQRPTATMSKLVRRVTYRGALGLNVGSALRNLTQSANTYAKLGEKYTVIGYTKLLKRMATNDLDELYQVGVLDDGFIQDRKISAIKGVMERLDKGLFFLFEKAEQINRGSAYFGAKSRALAKGKSEQEAIQEALKIVRDTQFTFGSIDTPPILQSDLVKVFSQFQSFNVKQAEFLTEMVKNKEFAGAIRWVAANLAIIGLAGEALGLEYKDMIPFSGVLTGETKLGQTPIFRGVKGATQAALAIPDKYGNVPEGGILNRFQENKDFIGGLTAAIPAGVQASKTYKGLKAVQRGFTTSASGRAKYPVDQSIGSKIQAGVMGEYSGAIARFYYANKLTPLGDTDTKTLQKKIDSGADPKQAFYDLYVQRMARSDKPAEEKERILKELKEVLGLSQKISLPGQDALAVGAGGVAAGASGYEAAKQDKERYKKLSELLNSDLSDEALNEGFQALGFTPEDASYYEVARQDNDLKMEFIKDILTGVPEDQRLEALIPLRKEMNGKMILTGTPNSSTAVADELYKEGIITDDERKYLKSIEIDKKTGQAKKIPGKAKKPKKPKQLTIRKVSAGRAPKIASRSTKAIKLKAIKAPSIKPINVRLRASGGSRKINTVEDFKKQLLARKGR